MDFSSHTVTFFKHQSKNFLVDDKETKNLETLKLYGVSGNFHGNALHELAHMLMRKM